MRPAAWQRAGLRRDPDRTRPSRERVRTTTSAGPLNALRSGAGKRSNLVGSPLSVATISPGPSMVNFMWSFAPGAIMPAASVTWTVMKERSMPSARTFERSADRASFAGASAVLTVSVAHSLPFLRTTTFQLAGLVDNVVPAHAIFVLSPLPASERFATNTPKVRKCRRVADDFALVVQGDRVYRGGKRRIRLCGVHRGGYRYR